MLRPGMTAGDRAGSPRGGSICPHRLGNGAGSSAALRALPRANHLCVNHSVQRPGAPGHGTSQWALQGGQGLLLKCSLLGGKCYFRKKTARNSCLRLLREWHKITYFRFLSLPLHLWPAACCVPQLWL